MGKNRKDEMFEELANEELEFEGMDENPDRFKRKDFSRKDRRNLRKDKFDDDDSDED